MPDDHERSPSGGDRVVAGDAIRRRDALRALVTLGVATGLTGCASGRGAASAEPAAPAAPAMEHAHPAEGDRLVFAFGERAGEVIAPHDIERGAAQVFAYVRDADGPHVANESRLGQVMLVRLDPADLSEATRRVGADGVVAYSAICTHTGCEVSDWDARSALFQCPCHESEFDPADNGAVVQGPARRRLAALPLRIASDGALVVAGGFTGAVGAERPR